MARRDYRKVKNGRQIRLESGLWVDVSEYRSIQNQLKIINKHNREIRKLLRQENLYLGETNKNRKFFDPTPSPYDSHTTELKHKKIREDLKTGFSWEAYYNTVMGYNANERFLNYELSYRGAIDKVFNTKPTLAKEIQGLFDELPEKNRANIIEILTRTDEAFTLDYIYEKENIVAIELKARNIKAGLKRAAQKYK